MKYLNRFIGMMAVAAIACIATFSLVSCGSDDDDPKVTVRIVKFDVTGESGEVSKIQDVFKKNGIEYNRTYSGNTKEEIQKTLKGKCTDAMLELSKSTYSFSSQHVITVEGRYSDDTSAVIYTGTLNPTE